MKFAVIGTGGVGGYFGGLLAHSGHPVTFVARGEHYRTLAERGLALHTVHGQYQIAPVQVVDSISRLERPDVVIFATKTYDRDEASAQLNEVVSEETVIIPTMNGIDNDLEMKKHLANARVVAGLVYIVSTRTAPGLVEQTAGPRTIIFGNRQAKADPKLKEIESVMKNAGIAATASDSIEVDLWTKFIWLTAWAGMTSVCRTPIGPIVADRSAFELLVRCLDEGIAVAHAYGVMFDDAARNDLIRKSEEYLKNAPHAKSSMLVDIENRRRIEVDSLNGAMARLGRAKSIDTPIQSLIHSALKLASENYLR